MGSEIMPNLYDRYSRSVYYDPEEGEFVALCGEFPGISAFGDTRAEALWNLDDAIEGVMEVHEAENMPLPEPRLPPPPTGES